MSKTGAMMSSESELTQIKMWANLLCLTLALTIFSLHCLLLLLPSGSVIHLHQLSELCLGKRGALAGNLG